MRPFARRCGLQDAAREAAVERVLGLIDAEGLELVRLGWCDLHGVVRGKTLTADAVRGALLDGVGMVSTLMLKDVADRTAYPIFEPGGADSLPGFGQGNNFVLLPDPDSLRVLPWVEATGWLRAQPWLTDGSPVVFDTRRILESALARLREKGYRMVCGLEVEFHIYRIEDTSAQMDPDDASWPGEPPRVSMIHPGYHLLGEDWFDLAEPALRIVQRTAQSLGMPLLSLEVELGPSQVEAVFAPTDALTAADNMVLFRSAVKMALRRAGYHATFVCRPPFRNVMSSGWHLHQSLVDIGRGRNVFQRDEPATDVSPLDARQVLSDLGAHYLAGLLAHARGATVFCTPTANGYGRFRPNELAPQSVLWGPDNRGAMLRVVGESGDPATRIENRAGEPAANPYLYFASQIYAGLDGIERKLPAPEGTRSPYATGAAEQLPTNLAEALDALAQDEMLCDSFGAEFVRYFDTIKRQEVRRLDQAEDKDAFHRREFFGRL